MDTTAKGAKKNTSPNVIHLQYYIYIKKRWDIYDGRYLTYAVYLEMPKIFFIAIKKNSYVHQSALAVSFKEEFIQTIRLVDKSNSHTPIIAD